MQKKLDKEVIQGRFFKINKKITKRITAKYHRIKDFKMDPRGYFLIDLDRKKNLLRVGYCTISKQENSNASKRHNWIPTPVPGLGISQSELLSRPTVSTQML